MVATAAMVTVDWARGLLAVARHSCRRLLLEHRRPVRVDDPGPARRRRRQGGTARRRRLPPLRLPGARHRAPSAGIHFDGTTGIQGWYDILGALLPDLKIEITHEYDTIGCCLREMTASGTHSLEFAGVEPTGKFLKWEAIALYIFDEDEPGKLLGERAYWDNDALIKQMKGEESPPLVGLLENPRILEHASVKSVHKRA